MAKILLLFVLLVTVEAAHRHHHPKFTGDAENPLFKQAACSSSDLERERQAITEKSKCGEPKEVFVYINQQETHKVVSPAAVWVKRCVGLCDHDSTEGASCIPLQKRTIEIPVRIFNTKTQMESCVSHLIEEHVECGCCAGSPEECTPAQLFDTSKCACRCPNWKEKRNCRSKAHQIMRWKKSECACVEVKRKKGGSKLRHNA